MAKVLDSFSLVLSTVAATIDTALGSTQVDPVRFPKTNLLDKVHPLRICKLPAANYPSTSTGEFAVFFNLPTGITVAGAFVDNANFTGNVLFQTANTIGTSLDNITMEANGLTKDNRTGRIKGYFRFSSPIFTNGTTIRKIKFTCSSGGTIDSSFGLTDLAIGAISFFEESQEVSYPGGYINNIEYEVVTPVEKSQFDTGTYEAVEIGDPYLTIDVPNRVFLQETQESSFLQVVHTKTSPLIFWENEGDLSHTYTVKLDTNKSKLDYKVRGKAFESKLSFIELI